jgi:hypothetical protein
MSLFPIALFTSVEKARPLQQRFQEAGVAAKLRCESPLARMWFVPQREAGEQVLVPTDQIAPAERLLSEWDRQGLLREAIRCPECKSLRVLYPQYAENSLLTNLLVGLAATLHLVERDFYCEDCHYTWPKHGPRARRDRPHMAPYYFIEGVEQTTLSPQAPAASPPAQEEPPEQRKAA